MSDKQSPSRARTATATSRLEGSLQLLNAAAAESAVSLVEFLGALQSGTDVKIKNLKKIKLKIIKKN